MINPLLAPATLPLFDQIQPEHVSPAMDALLARAETALAEVTQDSFAANWTGISRVLDVATENLSRAWGAVSHLNSVADTPELRAAYNAALPRVTEFWTRLGADERLYAKYKAIDVSSLNAEQRQAHKNAVRNFVLSGAELQGQDRVRFAEIQERQAELSQKFSENALDATEAFAHYAQEGELAGVPQDVIDSARSQAQAEGQSGYKLTLKMPSYLPVMQFAQSSALRETLYRAYNTRASDQARASTASLTTAPSWPRSWPCGRRNPACWVTRTSARCRWWPRWPTRRPRSSAFCVIWPGVPAPTPKKTWPTCAPLPPSI